MRSVIYTKYGSPEVLTLTETEKPAPKHDEVLIRVKASTVNRTDCAILRAKPFLMRFGTGLFKPIKQIPGTSFSGIVEGAGKDVVSFKAGDKVFGFDDMGLSSHAEYLSIPANKAMATIPANISWQEAAASCEGFHYAYNMIKKTKLKNGQRVLVNGATGAIGSAAVQLLNYFGAEITAVCNTKNMELVRSLGAGKIIDYTTTDFTKEDQQYAFIFDAVGKSSFGRCKPLLQKAGVYISSELGWMAENIFLALFTPLTRNKKVIFPVPVDTKGSILFTRELMEQGKFKPVIDREYPLEQIAEAYRYVETGEKTGNVVITL